MPADQVPTAGHNVKDIEAAIAKRFMERYRIESEIASKTEELRRAKSKNWKELKAETAIDGKDLQLRYGQFKRYQEIKDFDEEDRLRVQDHLRLLFHTADLGETADLFDAVDRADAEKRSPKKPKGKSEDKKADAATAYNEGYAKGEKAEGSRDDNPYEDGSPQFQNWNDGWDDAQAKNAEGIKAAAAE